eukprot:scaffold1474_cov256-Pinguiococcus_pyrenoidosus.AAC.28
MYQVIALRTEGRKKNAQPEDPKEQEVAKTACPGDHQRNQDLRHAQVREDWPELDVAHQGCGDRCGDVADGPGQVIVLLRIPQKHYRMQKRESLDAANHSEHRAQRAAHVIVHERPQTLREALQRWREHAGPTTRRRPKIFAERCAGRPSRTLNGFLLRGTPVSESKSADIAPEPWHAEFSRNAWRQVWGPIITVPRDESRFTIGGTS